MSTQFSSSPSNSALSRLFECVEQLPANVLQIQALLLCITDQDLHDLAAGAGHVISQPLEDLQGIPSNREGALPLLTAPVGPWSAGRPGSVADDDLL